MKTWPANGPQMARKWPAWPAWPAWHESGTAQPCPSREQIHEPNNPQKTTVIHASEPKREPKVSRKRL